MDKLSLREAVKHFDVSRPTLQKALKSGKISGVQDGKRRWLIDPAELSRVYRAREEGPVSSGQDIPVNITTENTSLEAELEKLKGALALAETKVVAAEELAKERAAHIEDLRRMLPSPHGDSKGWLSRLIGSKRR